MVSAKNVVFILGLSILAEPVDSTRVSMESFQEQLEIDARANTSENSMAMFCPSLCIPCEDGERTVFISRSKGMVKTVLDIALLPLTGAYETAITFGPNSYYSTQKAFGGSLGNECPEFEVVVFDNGEPRTISQSVLQSMMTKDDYLALFKKDLDKLYLFDQALEKGETLTAWDKVKNAVFPERPEGKLPLTLNSYVKYSELFCGDHGEAFGHVTEEAWIEGFKSKVPFVNWKPFWNKCKKGAQGKSMAHLTDKQDVENEEACVDTNNGAKDFWGYTCTSGGIMSYSRLPSQCGKHDDNDFSAQTMCCACGGGKAQS